jgi:succinylglutamic semialdehyde dehydrogenase
MSAGLFIGGTWRQGRGAALVSRNPATSAPIWESAGADARDVEDAVASARAAFAAWAECEVEERLAAVHRFKSLLQEEADAFTALICEDTGKIGWDARGEVQAMIGKADISAQAYDTRTGVSVSEAGGVRTVLRHRAHGVMAVFGPYNFPGHLPNGHIIPALIAGNTVVFKPSEQTPLVAEAYVKLWEKARLPSGVLNLVQGARETGVALAAHEGIDGVLFTGSAEVGALLHRQFAGRPEKMLALEMGGNNPLIVWDAADAEAAASIIVQSAFLTSGQRCTCARRLIVQKGSAAIDAAVALAKRVTVGVYTDTQEPYMGPLIGNGEAEKLLAAQEALIDGGAKSLLRMERLRDGLPFVSPAILDVTGMRAREDREYFGPLLQVIQVADFNAALREANATRFGLSAGLISDDAVLYERFIRRIRAGIVNRNRPTNGASSALPFGGIGASGNHRPSAFYAADYCAFPVAAQEQDRPVAIPLPGIRP